MNHNDTMIKDERRLLLKNIPLTLFVTFACERGLETEQNCNILTPSLMTVSVVSFWFSRASQPEVQGPSSLLDDGFLYCILSPTGLENSIGVPRAPSAGCGFPYHTLSRKSLILNSSGTPRAPSAGLSLTHLISNFSDSLSSQSYMIVQRPLNRPLNLWNGMFDRHQTEITVMQFRGHSLPVHQSMSVS